MFENPSIWARLQPRKEQWERAARFYMPHVHKSYANFTGSISAATKDGGIWGPRKKGKKAVRRPLGHFPPASSPAEDKYEWGVGEEAEFISFGPIVDNNNVLASDLLRGFESDLHPDMRVTNLPVIHRITKRLLYLLHTSAVESGVSMRAEFGPQTFALYHGFKIAVWPMPMYYDPSEDMLSDPAAMERVFNAQGPDRHVYRKGRSFYLDKVLKRITYWLPLKTSPPSIPYPQSLYRRWLGDEGSREGGTNETERLCLPPLLLHPVEDRE